MKIIDNLPSIPPFWRRSLFWIGVFTGLFASLALLPALIVVIFKLFLAFQ